MGHIVLRFDPSDASGYGVKMYIIVQDITQLNGVYGKENGIMSNCHIRIAAAPNHA